MEGFQLLRPLWLLALLPLGLLFYLRRRHPAERSPWHRVVDAHLLSQLLVDSPQLADHQPQRLAILLWVIVTVALAGPSWQSQPPYRVLPDVPPLVIALDLSRSMTAQDIAPTRLAVARAKIRTLLQGLSQRPVALHVYTLQSHSVMPFTEDRRLITGLLEGLVPEMMPAQGSSATATLRFARRQFEALGRGKGDLLLITDGVDEAAAAVAEELAKAGVRVSLLAVGTPKGGYIPDELRGYLYGASGPVTTALDAAALQQVASRGGGQFVSVTRDNSDIEMLLKGFSPPELSDGQVRPSETGERWLDGGPWLLLLALPLALWLFRSGNLLVLVVALGLASPPADAFDWSRLWRNDGQRAQRLLDENRLDEAAVLFNDPYRQGLLHYRAGNYAEALQRFSEVDTVEARFGRANTLLRLGRYAEAQAVYREVLAREPGHQDARFNQRLLEQALRASAGAEPEDADADGSLPGPQSEQGKAQAKKGERIRSAQEMLDAPTQEDRNQQAQGESMSPPDTAGSAGGGALLIGGEEHPEMATSGSQGEGLEMPGEQGGGDAAVARQGGGEGAGQQSTAEKALAPNQALPAAAEDERRDAGESVATAEESEDVDSASRSPSSQAADSDSAPADTAGEQLVEREAQDETESGDQQGVSPGREPALPGEENETVDLPEAEGQRDVDVTGGELEGMALGREEAIEAMENWLDSIEDNPSGLLREKFRREYRRNPPADAGRDPW